MLYADSPALRGLRYVVMDEVHYLADRFRGAVWEEVIIHLPQTVRLVSLSATVSNAEEFGDWLDTVRGDTEVIVSEIRPVPLEQHVLVRGDLLPLFDDRAGIATAQVNQELMRIRSFKGPKYENNRRAQAMSSARNGGYEAAASPPEQGRQAPGALRERAAHRAARPPGCRGAARAGQPAAGDLLHLQPRRLRRRGAAGAPLGRAADLARGARRDPRDRRGAHPHAARRGSRGARLLRVARQPRARRRLASRRPAAGVQGGRRGALPAQARQGRLRDRDARARHQHARAHRRAREAREVQRRGARRDHVGGVHPAHRSRRPPRHRRRGSRGHPVDRGARSAGGRGARLAAHLPAELELPADVQHGRQPDRPVRPAARARRSSSRRSRSSRPTGPSSASPGRCASRRSRSPGTRRR